MDKLPEATAHCTCHTAHTVNRVTAPTLSVGPCGPQGVQQAAYDSCQCPLMLAGRQDGGRVTLTARGAEPAGEAGQLPVHVTGAGKMLGTAPREESAAWLSAPPVQEAAVATC